ncbi:hypothetical protein PM10SUCC1_01380 [Propionigenium maris DSM 9537]|uniref:Uncharacterized protein n=1 Tax=Propionigenium maris DSM 9537 TaxID=1123000 RepID=A0A9W6GG38_9FUSO|nr:hypothetical protein PM10SUCC1_01380 [Propionigenium maris DSM 9537]
MDETFLRKLAVVKERNLQGGRKGRRVFTRECLGDIMNIDKKEEIDGVTEGGQGVTGRYK